MLARTLVEIVHDEGYGSGELLISHMNSAFGTKDMHAERVVDNQPNSIMCSLYAVNDKWFYSTRQAADTVAYRRGECSSNAQVTLHKGVIHNGLVYLLAKSVPIPVDSYVPNDNDFKRAEALCKLTHEEQKLLGLL